MNRNSENGFSRPTVVEQPEPEAAQPIGVAAPSTDNGRQPFVPQTGKKRPGLKENAGVILAGAVVVVALVLFVLGRFPHQPSTNTKKSAGSTRQQAIQSVDAGGSGATSILPILDATRSQEIGTEHNDVGPEEIGRTAQQRSQQSVPSNLGGIMPFNNQSTWDAGPYQQETQPTPLAEASETPESRNEREAMEKPSLVFVKNTQETPSRSQETAAALDLGIGLPLGTRLRARLESAVNTAVQTPVVAVVEYNYEQNGEVLIPAGAKVFGHLEAADRSGYIGVRFDSMQMPDGSNVGMEADATDLQFRPLRGKVEGKHRGKNILVRSASGVGEVVATLAGRGSLNEPLSENDLLRERVSNNIAQASDEEVNKLAVTEGVVVSVPAGTEIYVVLQKAVRGSSTSTASVYSAGAQSSSHQSADQLRQLLQLQKELNQETGAATANQ